MKIDKKIFISALLVLVMLVVMGSASATDPLDKDNLTAENAVSVDVGDSLDDSLKSAEGDLLSEGEATIYVDGSYDGDEQGTEDMPYKTISSAVGAATAGGETIFIKDGEYTQDAKISFTKSINLVGQSRDGVIIKSIATNGVFETVENGVVLSFKNLNFIDITAGSIGTLNVGGDSNLDVINCTFDNCKSKYGVMWIKTTGTVNIEDVDILNSAATTNKGATAIYFQGAGNYNVKNTLIDNAQNTVTGFSYAPIYTVNSASSLTIDNVRIYNCGGNTYGMIYTNGIATVTNSRIINNTVPGATGKSIVYAARNTLTIEQTVIVNNSATDYLVFCNTGGTAILNYNYIANNTITTSGNVLPVYGAGTSGTNSINADSNYWGSNDPTITGTTVNNYVIENNGVYTLNNGDPLPEGKTIPSIDEPGDEPVGDENTTYVSPDGDDNNIGSADSPVATIAKAVELAKDRTGEIIIQGGTYTENNIELDSNVTWSITGIGNVVIDGNASSNSILILHGGAATVTNIKFTNNKAKYGGAIMVNSGSGTSRNVADINLTIDNCIFEDIGNNRGGSIYLWYTKGNFIVKNSQFINSTASGWGGAICVGYSALSDGLNLVINGSTFEDCSGNNGGAAYLQAHTITITDSVFNHNTASYDSGAMQLYNSTTTIDNCIITNNVGGSKGVAIKETTATGYIPTLTITNSIIENNTGRESTLPAILVDKTTLDVSYSSIVNDLSVETVTASGYSAIYGQGIAILNNNWWGTNDPRTKVTGTNITMDNWVIMNVEANATEAIPGDKVTLTVDFNHVNTTAGEIEELTGGVIPKTYKVQLSSNAGTIVPSTLTVSDGATKSAVYTVGNLYDVVSVSCDEALVELSFVPEVPPYYGIIYVSKDGNDDNNGSEEAPVASIAKAAELATRVGGSHQIIINEGSYTPDASITITDDLTITGNGAVVIDADGIEKLIDLPYSSPVKGFTVELNNLTLINGNGNQYGTVYNYADAYLFLNNVNISDCTGSYLGGIITTTGNTTLTDCVISDCTAGRIIYASVGYNKPIAVTLINTTLKNNVAFIDDGSDLGQGYAAIDVSTTTKNTVLNLIDSHFINNTGKLGTVYTTSDKVVMNVEGTEFIGNTVLTGNGGAINGYSMNINNSTFINNRATKDNVYGVATGGAINIARLGTAVITNSKFVDNSATGNGNSIYNGWKLTINNCAIIDNTKGNVIYHNGEDNVMDAKYNWWGTNDDPGSLIGVGEYEDDYGYGYEDCEFDASKWVVMNVVNNLTSQDPLDINDTIVFTVDFTHYTDSTGTLYELADKIPEVEVSADAIKGFFDKDSATTEGNVVTFVYTADIGGVDEINITSAKAVNTTLININEPIVVEVVYVSPDGNDSNVGYFDEPVATIAHAIEIAERGKIVIFEGTYTIDSTLAINKDLDIRGYENDVVTIDGNLKRVFEVNANLNLTNLVFTNAKYSNGAVMSVESDANVTIDGCTFYNNTATSTSGGQIVNNKKGNMTVNNSKFYENVASRGVVASQVGNMVINNSEFYGNDMTGYTAYGIVYFTNTDVIVENTVFRNNKASNSAGIYANRANGKPQGSLRVINSTFKNNVANKGSGAAIYSAAYVTVSVEDSTFINNTAVTSGSSGGNGGAVYSGGNSIVNIVDSVFIDNYAVDKNGLEDAGIYVYGSGTSSSTLSISNSVILPREGHTGVALYVCDGATATAENNFWGDNSKANTNANVAKWVIMTADYDQVNSILTVAFNSTNSTDGTIADYDGILPDGFNVSVSSSSGGLDEILPIVAGQASTRYTAVVADTFIAVKCADAEVIIPVVVEPHIIYVAVDGDDNNDGSKDAPVATIAKAIELADEGLIVIQEGTYITTDLGIISDDLNITGNGTVIIDAQNSDRILYVGSQASVVLKNLIMINGASLVDSGALLGNANELTLINCTLANSSAGQNNGGAIYNVGKLTIINSTIANNTAKMGGAIFTNSYAELTIINSTFENNIASGNGNSGGGAIFAQQLAGLFIDNSSFIENEALDESSGGAIFVSHSDAEYTITNSRFIANHANGKDNTGGGAIYMVGLSNTQKSGKLSISNTLFEENTADTCGAAIYARATTVDVSNSVIFANKDPAGFAVYGYKTDTVTPTVTLNDNWWGTNDDPNDYVGGYNYKPTLERWVILTATNDTPFVEGETVKITANLNTWTDGEQNGTLVTPITIPREVIIDTTFDSIEGVMENGEFEIDYVVPADLDFVSVTVDVQNVDLLKVKTETVVEAVPVSGKNGDTVGINVTVKTADGFIVGDVPVTVLVDDIINSTYTVDENGKVYIPIDGLTPGNYSALIVFDENDDYLSSNATVDVVINKVNTTLSADDVTVTYKNTTELVAAITDADGNPLSVELNVDFNGENYNVTADEKGQITIPVGVLTPDTYVATISYAGDETYAASSTTANVVVEKAGTSISAKDVAVTYKNATELVATIVDVYGDAISADLTVELNGENYNVTSDENGQITLPIGVISCGTYVATISYAGNDTYAASSTTANVVVNQADSTITGLNTTVTYNYANNVTIATISSVYGRGLAVNVNIKLNGEEFVVKSNPRGQIRISTAGLDYGTYTAEITYKGYGNYKASNATAQITVAKVDTVITAPDISVNFSNPTRQVIATLTDVNGKPLSVYVNVTFNGETSAVKANSKGQVTISTKALTPNTYAATISYAGDEIYTPANATAQVTVTKADAVITAPDVSVAYKNTTNKTIATITSPYGKALAVYVNVTVNGETYVVRANYKGEVSVSTAKLAPGTYNATISYKGNGNYKASTATTQIIVEKAETVISATDVSVVYKDVDGQLVATLTNAYGKPLSVYVHVNLNGKDYDVRADSNGQIIIPTSTLSPGTYTATITYNGNGNYNPTSTTAQITVNKADTVITAQSVTVDCGDPDGKLVATLTNAYGKALSVYVTVNLNGVSYDVRADSNGQIIIPTKDLAAGTYQATITYKGNGNYNPTSTTAQITVKD